MDGGDGKQVSRSGDGDGEGGTTLTPGGQVRNDKGLKRQEEVSTDKEDPREKEETAEGVCTKSFISRIHEHISTHGSKDKLHIFILF